MASKDDKSKKPGKDDSPPGATDKAAEVLAVDAVGAKVDASEKMSYRDYARQRPEPLITVQQIIQRKGPPEPKKRELWPDMQIKQVVMWGELPKEDPPKPERSP